MKKTRLERIPRSGKSRKIYYHKLIRDKIPHVMAKRGAHYSVKKLTSKKFEKELYLKVGEEATGLLAAKSKDELVDELADVHEVLEAIRKFKKIKPSYLRDARKKNMQRKGGFDKRLYLVWAEDNGYRTNERTYKR